MDGVLPSVSSGMVPLRNTYQEDTLPSTASVNNVPANGLQHSASSIASTSHNAPFFPDNSNKSKYGKKRTTNKYTLSSEEDSIRSSIVKNSKLHPTANEFVPNNVKFKKDKFNKWKGRNNAAESSFNASMQDFRSKSFAMNASLSDNRYKNENYSNNRRDGNYKQKNYSQQSMQTPRSNYKDRPYNMRNYNKFQNGKYYNRKHEADAEQGGAHMSMTELAVSSASDSRENKASGEEIQKNDSSLSIKMSINRKETSTDENNDIENASTLRVDTQRNNRSKRFNTPTNSSNYYKSNFYDDQSESVAKQKTAVTTRYTRRRNNEASANNKEKVENWRDRAEDKETTQGKNLSKKYEIGIFIRFIRKKIRLHCYVMKLYN